MTIREYLAGEAPCKSCNRKQEGCHSRCLAYLEWKDKFKEEGDKIHDVVSKEATLNAIRNKGINNIKNIHPRNRIIRSTKK